MDNKKRMFLIDGTAVAYRSYWALINNPLRTSKGIPTGAVFGFVNSLLRILKDEKPDYIAVVFDSGKPTFRHEIYTEYKATREKMPEDLREQIPYIFKTVEAFNIPLLIKDRYEADDIMATLAVQAEKQSFKTFLVTNDKDFMQLVCEDIVMYKPAGRTGEAEIVDIDAVIAKFGVKPSRIIDLLSLMGDTSDNVPGIPGVGEKTAVKLLNEMDSLENILNNPDAIESKSVSQKVRENIDKAKLSRELVILEKNVPLDISIDELEVKEPDPEKVKELFLELEFHSMLNNILSISEEKPSEKKDYFLIKNKGEFENLIRKLKKCDSTLVFDVETTSSDPFSAELVGISFSFGEQEAYYIPVRVEGGQKHSFAWEEIKEPLKEILESENIPKCGHNIKFDAEVLQQYEIYVKPIKFDTMIASYLLNPESHQHNLNSVSIEYLSYKKIPIGELIGSGKNQKNMKDVELDKIYVYGCEDSDITLRLKNLLEPILEEKKLTDLMNDIEIPLIDVLIDMESTGVKVDTKFLGEMSRKLDNMLIELGKDIFYEAGEDFNLNSPKQLGNILFEKLKIHEQMGFKKVAKTKIGYKTDVHVLEKYSDNPFIEKILKYRELNKLKNTYVDALPRLINRKTGKIHTSFNQTVAATGRLSSTNPNLQNIPIRKEIGREIRKAFIPSSKENMLVSADYSQIELRLMAHLSGDKTLIEAFRNNEDVHGKTASLIFNVAPEEVTTEMRYKAKSINFGIIYGMGPFKLASEIKISTAEAQEFINSYFSSYPDVNRYIFEQLALAKEEGFVKTLLNRIRYIPEIHSENQRIRKNAENIAINTPIQGTAADMIKIAMINIYHRLKGENIRSKMILQIHDELVFDVPKDELDMVMEIVKTEMENALSLSVPVKVDIGHGENWFEAH
jgi:DNA polymerase-1